MTGPLVPASASKVLRGVAAHLEAVSALSAYRVFRMVRHDKAPDRSVLLTAWVADDEANSGDLTVGIQARVRGATDMDADAVIDIEQDVIRPAILAVQNGARFPNGVPVTLAWCDGATGLGLDAQLRYEWAATYMIRTDRAGLT